MGKITSQNKKGKITIINRLSYPETVNERVYNIIVSGILEGLLPVAIHQKGKETRIECVVQGLVTLEQYFSDVVSKKMFLNFVHEIALQIKCCEKNMINANNLMLQSDMIFIDPQTQKVKCVFWPLVNNQKGNPPHLFLKQLPFEMKFSPYEDDAYLEKYKAFFSQTHPFSINNFDKMVLELLGKKSSKEYMPSSESSSGMIVGKLKAERKNNIEYNPFEKELSCEEEQKVEQEIKHDKNYVFCVSCGAKNQNSSNFCFQCGTELKVKKKKAQAILIRMKTGKSYLIEKEIYRVGKEKRCCDLFIDDNDYISKRHADIITRENRYYVIDRNSTNKTFVNGEQIPPEKEVEIFSGMKIQFVNEVFVFKSDIII